MTGEEWIDENLESMFAPIKREEITIQCTLNSLMKLSKLSKKEALNVIKKCGTPLEHKGWYEITLSRGPSGG